MTPGAEKVKGFDQRANSGSLAMPGLEPLTFWAVSQSFTQ